ncbi:uncharacterized protein LOC124817998 [Hydra vulgaris]|uniref:uncharacterized protein LOC124817998 n=1 Tax=Hydra vulgaris TaxID=6087 RepID=UPI001F5E3D4C|nr:uncharacterized protein LOC124817998 [Hydra vulgaris]
MLDEGLNLKPTEWGWKSTDGHLEPIPTDKEIAPPNLLKVIRCNCRSSSKNQCQTKTCICRKNGMKCMAACGGCHGMECSNKTLDIEEEHENSDKDSDEEENSKNIFDEMF